MSLSLSQRSARGRLGYFLDRVKRKTNSASSTDSDSTMDTPDKLKQQLKRAKQDGIEVVAEIAAEVHPGTPKLTTATASTIATAAAEASNVTPCASTAAAAAASSKAVSSSRQTQSSPPSPSLLLPPGQGTGILDRSVTVEISDDRGRNDEHDGDDNETEEDEVEEQEQTENIVNKIIMQGKKDSNTGGKKTKKAKRKLKQQNHNNSSSMDEQDKRMEAIMDRSIERMLPRIVQAISDKVSSDMSKKLNKLEGEVKTLKQNLHRERVRNEITNDKYEMHARRDNIVVEGVKEKAEGEESETTSSLIDAVQGIAQKLNIQVPQESIGAIHRIGRKSQGKPRPIIVRTNHIVKSEIMARKKQLRSNAAVKEEIQEDTRFGNSVAVYEDLTAARRKILKMANDCPNVDFCYSRDGVIICRMRDGQWRRVEDADGLFHLGMDDLDYREIYPSLKGYSFS